MRARMSQQRAGKGFSVLSVRKHSKSLHVEGTKGLCFLVLQEEGLLRAGGSWVTSFLPFQFPEKLPSLLSSPVWHLPIPTCLAGGGF